jgi:hypothetical protein
MPKVLQKKKLLKIGKNYNHLQTTKPNLQLLGWMSFIYTETAFDRNLGNLLKFEVEDGSEFTYLKIATRIEEKHKIKYLCTHSNKVCNKTYGHDKLSDNRPLPKAKLAWYNLGIVDLDTILQDFIERLFVTSRV